MTDATIIKIPTKTHLKKFLLKIHNQKEPFKLDGTTSVGKNLMSSLVDKIDYVNMNDQLNDVIQVTLSKRFAERSPRIKRLIYINSLIEEMFKESLILWIFCASFEGSNPNRATKSFLDFFQIDESEYSYDAAYKVWQRYKKKDENWLTKIPRRRTRFTPNLSRTGQ